MGFVSLQLSHWFLYNWWVLYHYSFPIGFYIIGGFCTITALTHWGRATHICFSKLTTIGLDNGLSPGQRQAIIWTNAGILLIGPLGTNFSEILLRIQTFSFKKMHLKVSSAKWRPFCLGLNVLSVDGTYTIHTSQLQQEWLHGRVKRLTTLLRLHLSNTGYVWGKMSVPTCSFHVESYTCCGEGSGDMNYGTRHADM